VRYTELSPERVKSFWEDKGVRRECTALLFVLADLAHPALARTYINCTTREVVIVSGSSEDKSSTKEKDMGFWVDDIAKTVTFADHMALTVMRFDENSISANRDDISYEFDRQNGTLSYATSTTKGRVTTVIVGSGRCESGPAPRR
jgi:hypothetical protein